MLLGWLPFHVHDQMYRVWPSNCASHIQTVRVGMQAAYGKSALAATSFFTYVGLGLGFLASTLSLPFGVYVLLCQREPVRYIQVIHILPFPSLVPQPWRLPLLDTCSVLWW